MPFSHVLVERESEHGHDYVTVVINPSRPSSRGGQVVAAQLFVPANVNTKRHRRRLQKATIPDENYPPQTTVSTTHITLIATTFDDVGQC
jgi:hypothetical protein